jgi:two-component system response regulator LytT
MKIKSITNKNSVSGSDFSDKVIKNTRLEIVSNDKNISEAVDTPSSITPKTIFVKTNSVLIRLDAHDILFIEALADYIAVHTATQRYIVHSTMKEVLTKLPLTDFIRIHNSYIVRFDAITSIEGYSVVVNKKIIPISRSKHPVLMDRMTIL